MEQNLKHIGYFTTFAHMHVGTTIHCYSSEIRNGKVESSLREDTTCFRLLQDEDGEYYVVQCKRIAPNADVATVIESGKKITPKVLKSVKEDIPGVTTEDISEVVHVIERGHIIKSLHESWWGSTIQADDPEYLEERKAELRKSYRSYKIKFSEPRVYKDPLTGHEQKVVDFSYCKKNYDGSLQMCGIALVALRNVTKALWVK